MIESVLAVVIASAALGAAAPWLAKLLPPSTSSRALSLAALVSALGTGFVVSTVGFSFVAQLPNVAGAGRWSVSSLHRSEPMPTALGVTACLALGFVFLVVLRRLTSVARDVYAATLACRRLGGGGGQLIVVDDARAEAYALSGLTAGRIVVSTSMLAALDPDEQRALLAHEASHLRHRHDLYVALSALSAAANPLLHQIPGLVRTSVERWADEDAAAHVGSRRLAARAIAKAGLATSTVNRVSVGTALAAGDHRVTQRASALLRPAPPPRRFILLGVLVMTTVTAGTAVQLAQATEHRFEQAHSEFVHGR